MGDEIKGQFNDITEMIEGIIKFMSSDKVCCHTREYNMKGLNVVLEKLSLLQEKICENEETKKEEP